MNERPPTEYTFTATDPQGRTISGTIVAGSSSDAARELIDQGLLPTSFRAGTLSQAPVEWPFLGPTHTPHLRLLSPPTARCCASPPGGRSRS